ncbi:MATE family efflux transporter [Anaerococcus sp.]|uniref:MATE family efflux transporter n=1 Tax=Anaerococcus TaxID=165779 RepID=UPI00258C6F1A|nr:MATE family efflux transporter [Anaerococcus sp.]MDU1828618.1 MATE family efflux transporter [Anaerococcus sp.]MDU1865132.1 MATE family efflux transporter [Anaerococcus sp.]MDU3210839.1 MATE family efflux transporter [Anaerococcus sp.]
MEDIQVNENKLGTMPIDKLLLEMAIPMVISMLVQSIYNIVDSMFVAQLSEDALTAVSLAFPVQNILIAFGVGIGVGSSALLSRFLGENNRERVGSVAIHGIVIAGITYVVFALLGLLFTKNYALHQGQNPVVTEYTKEYLYIVTIFSIGIFFQTLAEKLLQATSLTKYTMITQMSGAILNIILDPILIFGLFGFPRLEVKGAAIATVIGQVFGAIVGFYFNKNKNHDIKFTSKRFKFHGDIVKQIFWIGLPTIVMNTIGSLVVFALNTILKNFGSSAIASYGVMFKFQSFAFLPVFGISNALTTIVSYNYGAKKKDRIKESIGLSIKSSFVLMAIAVVIMWLFPKQLLAMFNATDNMLEIGVPMMRIVSLSYLVAVPAIVSVGGVFQSLGNWQIAIFQSFLRQFIILIPIFNLLSKTGSLNVAWWAFFIAEFTNSILCMFILRKEIKTKIDIL